jgi:hypothetical protein
MLGRTLPSGSDAISFHNTLFRVSELCWIKAVRLSPVELVVRVVAAILAVAWVLVMKSAKGTYYNVEFLLGLFPLVLAWSTAGSLRIGCTGDFEESYEERRGSRVALFRGWIDTLRAREPDWVYLQGTTYDLLLNPNRIAWIRPCYQWQLYPLVVIGAFAGYLYLLGLNLPIASYPVIDDFQILIFEGSTGTVRLLSYLIIAVAAVAFLISFKPSVEICGTGGVQDTFPMSSQDQNRLMDMIVGRTAPRESKGIKPARGQVQTMEVPVSPSLTPAAAAPASTAVAPAPVKEEETRATPPSVE